MDDDDEEAAGRHQLAPNRTCSVRRDASPISSGQLTFRWTTQTSVGFALLLVLLSQMAPTVGAVQDGDQSMSVILEAAARVVEQDDDNQQQQQQQQLQLASNANGSSTWQMLVAVLFESPVETNNWSNLVLALFIILLMLTTAIGNLFVIVAILIERNLRTIGNYLVLSLAIADLLVALLVMPLASVYLILDQWTLGVLLCDIWTSADVCCCTASILHLLAIALDRYWAVTRVDYIRCQRNERRILFMIFFVWMAACVISLGPAFGWKDAEYEKRILEEKQCLISQDLVYQIFATCATFFFPLTLTLVFYWKIYQVARKRIRRKLDNRAKLQQAGPPHPSTSSSSTAVPAASGGGGGGGGGNGGGQRSRQITKNQSIVKYSQKSGAAAKFTTSSSGRPPPLQGTISTNGTNKPPPPPPPPTRPSYSCDCLCHGANRAQLLDSTRQTAAATTTTTNNVGAKQQEPDGVCQALAFANEAKGQFCATNSRPDDDKLTAKELALGGNANELGAADETTGNLMNSGQKLDGTGDKLSSGDGLANDNSKDQEQSNFYHDDCDRLAMVQNEPINGANNSENLRRRQSNNINSGSSCSRCKRNRFQGSGSNSLASCSRASSLHEEEIHDDENDDDEDDDGDDDDDDDDGDDEEDGNELLLANNKNYDSLSSNNCVHELISMDTNSLDGDRTTTINEPMTTRRRAVARQRKSLGVASVRGLSGSQCECCSCPACCRSRSRTGAGDLGQSVTELAGEIRASGGGAGSGERHQAGPRAEDERRTIETILGKGGKLSHGVVHQPGPPMNAGHQLELGADCKEDTCESSPANINGWLGRTRRLVKRQLGPSEPTRNMIAICWRRLLMSNRERVNKTNQSQPCESATVLGPDQQSTSVLIVARSGHSTDGFPANNNNNKPSQFEVDIEEEAETLNGFCVVCHCPSNDQQTATSKQQVVIVSAQFQTEPTNLTAAVASSTTAVALSTAENLAQKANAMAATAAAAATSQTNSMRPIETPVQTSRLFLKQHSIRSSPTVQSQAAQMEGVESKRERKAAKTLAIITGVFVMCWLPFFVMAIAMPLLELKPHKYLFAFLLWLGYFNSMLNPIIYTIFSPDFRKAFKRLLCGPEANSKRKHNKRPDCGAANSMLLNCKFMRDETGAGGRNNGPRLQLCLTRLNSAICRCICCIRNENNNNNNNNLPKWNKSKRDEPKFETPSDTTLTPNPSPRAIPDKQQAASVGASNQFSKPKSIITNHF